MSNPKATRMALALYPPSWRARYGDEVHALLQESGGLRDVASLAWRALPPGSGRPPTCTTGPPGCGPACPPGCWPGPS